MRLLIMGGTEFVSQKTAKYFISKGYDVDLFTRGQKPILYKGYHLHHKGDRKQLEVVRSCLGDITYDYVIDISAYKKEDVEILTSVLNTSRLKKYVFCSSGAVYSDSSEYLKEDFKRGYNTNWQQYGTDKLEAEEYLLSLHKTKSFPVTIFRPSYIYGPENNLYRETYFMDLMINQLDVFYPEGDVKTQFVHIDDVIKCFESALNLKQTSGEAYNLTHERIITWPSLIQSIQTMYTQKNKMIPISTELMETLDIKRTRAFFPYRNVTYLMSIDKLKSHGLCVPAIDLEAGLLTSKNWYEKEQPIFSDPSMNALEKLRLYWRKQ